jgi:hypothetical protein
MTRERAPEACGGKETHHPRQAEATAADGRRREDDADG